MKGLGSTDNTQNSNEENREEKTSQPKQPYTKSEIDSSIISATTIGSNPFLANKLEKRTDGPLESKSVETRSTSPIHTHSVTKELTLPKTSEELLQLLVRGRLDGEGYLIHWKGVPNDLYEEYREETLKLESLASEGKILYMPEGINKVDTLDGIGKRTLNDMNRYWLTINKQKVITGELIIRLTYKNHRTLIQDKEVKEKLNNLLANILDIFISTGVSKEVIKNFYVKEILWLETIIPSLMNSDGTYKGLVVKGKTKRDGSVLLRLLEELGLIVVYRDSEGHEIEEGNYREVAEYIHTYKNKVIERGPYISDNDLDKKIAEIKEQEKKAAEVVSTAANEAQREIVEVLHGDDTGIYRDWQFEKYTVDVKRLQTTYDELFMLWKEPANMRSGFKVKPREEFVVIPTIFSKISGVPEDIEQYWIMYDDLVNATPNTIVIKETELLPQKRYANRRSIPFDSEKGFLEEHIRNLNYYNYSYLREGLQQQIVRSINQVIFNATILTMEDTYLVLEVALNLPEKYLDMLQKYDYVKDIPKLIVYRSSREGFRKDEGILIELLHELGVDIVFLVPSGYNNIENVLRGNSLEMHRLYTMTPDLEIPSIINKAANPTEDSNTSENGGLLKKLGSWFMP